MSEEQAKPLHWYKPKDHPQDSEDAICIAHGIGGRYSIYPDGDGFLVWKADDEFTFLSGKTVDECKALAEAHWQAAFADRVASPPAKPAPADLREATDIHAEGERIAKETYKPEGGDYLWTDLVGAIQTGIAEERERNASQWTALRDRLLSDLGSNVGTYTTEILRYIPGGVEA